MGEEKLSHRLREAIRAKGVRDVAVARAAGISSSYLSKIFREQRTKLSLETVEKLASALGVSRRWLLTGEKENSDEAPIARFEVKEIVGPAPRGRLVKVASWASAGEATDYEEIASDWQLDIATVCPDADAVGVQIRGDSMLPVYQEGDIVVMMPSREPRTGCLVVGRLRDEGVLFKIFSEASRGIIRLSSYNPAYPPIERHRDDFQWICPVYETNRNVWR